MHRAQAGSSHWTCAGSSERCRARVPPRGCLAGTGTTLVAHPRTGRDIGSWIKQGLELRIVARLTAMREGQRQTIAVDLEMDLGPKATAGTAERLAVSQKKPDASQLRPLVPGVAKFIPWIA
jgi:hypothetical protein